jgi:hypothetical protein
MSQKLKIYFKQSNFNDFVSKIKDLSKISDVIKLKIDNESIFMYSLLGGETMVLAFKNYEIDTNEYLDIKQPLDNTINIIITNSKKFVKNLQFIKLEEKIEMNIIYKSEKDSDDAEARSVQIKNDKFKLQIETGESSEIKDITKQQLAKRLDLRNKNWSFKVKNDDFNMIKSLSGINSDDSRRILNINIEDYKIIFSENNLWELEVDESTEENKHLMINKRFLTSINDNGEDINFHVFETFILVKDKISQLMISFEQDFSQ